MLAPSTALDIFNNCCFEKEETQDVPRTRLTWEGATHLRSSVSGRGDYKTVIPQSQQGWALRVTEVDSKFCWGGRSEKDTQEVRLNPPS